MKWRRPPGRPGSGPAPATHVVALGALTVGLACTVASCGERAPAEPVELHQTPTQTDDTSPVEGDSPHGAADGTPDDTGAPGEGSAPGGRLWVVDAGGQPVGVLIQRGHPWMGDGSTTPDLLRDGVLLYAPADNLFFGVTMSSGQVLAPRLGVADPACNEPVVAGYYVDGPEVSGFGLGFVYRGAWYRVRGGEQLSLEPCAGIVKDGPNGQCVLHSGSCRGFPLDKDNQVETPTSFTPPLAFAWQ